jgi:hypothetical protein
MKTMHQILSTDEYVAEAQRLAIAQNKALKFFYRGGRGGGRELASRVSFLFFRKPF